MLLASVYALTLDARRHDHRLIAKDTRGVMGSVPYNLSHRLKHHPRHRYITATHTLDRFSHGIYNAGSGGLGMNKKRAHFLPALFQKPDGRYVDPHLPVAKYPTIGMVAVRSALKELGQPYVWAATGPVTFDCSGLVQWAYAHAGLSLAAYTGYEWNEGRMIPSRDILPGDLILFGDPTFHVGMYLGAGWMVDAPLHRTVRRRRPGPGSRRGRHSSLTHPGIATASIRQQVDPGEAARQRCDTLLR